MSKPVLMVGYAANPGAALLQRRQGGRQRSKRSRCGGGSSGGGGGGGGSGRWQRHCMEGARGELRQQQRCGRGVITCA